MKTMITLIVVPALLLSMPAPAQQPLSTQDDTVLGDSWARVLKDRSQRGTLHNALQNVRGDSGKWNDDPKLQRAPPLFRKPGKMLLDDWFDQLERTGSRPLTPADKKPKELSIAFTVSA